MIMTTGQQLIMIAMVIAGTMITRFLPFIVFPAGKTAPAYVRYLGQALPSAVFGLLVIYSLKDINLLTGNHGLPALISVAVVVGIHLRKKHMMLSIALGTICHMLLVQLVF